MPIESNENRPITPGETESSRYAHLPHPIFRDVVIRSHLHGIFQRYDLIKREVQMAGGPFTTDEDPVIESHLCGIFQRYDLIKKVEFTPDDPHNEEMNRRFDREEIHGKIPPPRLPPDETNQAQHCLVFLNNVRDRIYANDLVTDKNGDLIKVAICDTFTQAVITTDRSLSSARVILKVLDAEFSKNKRETWSMSEFNQSELMGRNGKGPILTGRIIIQLENGVGTFKNIFFNDNSSWSKDRSIRLAVMVEGEEGYLNGKRVQEGVSNPFRVFDCKSKVSEKPKWLKLTDKVLYIVKIGTRRADVLKNYNIKTVEDFLWWYYNQEHALRQILNIKRESAKEWLSMVDHVMQCADEFRAKYNALNNSSHPPQDVESNKNHANIESGNILNGNSVQHANVSGTPQIDPLTYLTFDGLDANTPFPMEGFGVSGSGGDGDGDSDYVGPFTGGNDGGGAWF